MDHIHLSKALSYVLRHAPWEYELELDDEGWTALAPVLEGLRTSPAFARVERRDLEAMMRDATKERFELAGNRIRALYGHSIPGKLKKQRGEPPALLYHGTVTSSLPLIRKDGLRPMS